MNKAVDLATLRIDIEGGMEGELTFRQIIDGLAAPMATTTTDGQIELVNGQLLDDLGITLEKLKDWQTSGIIHPDDLPRVVAPWRQSLEGGQPYELELRIRRAAGLYQWVRARGLPLRDLQDRIVRWCLLLADVSERKRTEALLEGEKRLLEMVAAGSPLEEVLEAMCRLVDTSVGKSACSILLIDETATFRHGAGPMLPAGTTVRSMARRLCARPDGPPEPDLQDAEGRRHRLQRSRRRRRQAPYLGVRRPASATGAMRSVQWPAARGDR